MLRSMTAFAGRERQGEWGTLSWEIRSVNHRYLEMSFRLPEEFRVLDGDIRKRIGKMLGRGKLDCALRFQSTTEDAGRFVLNEPLAQRLTELGRQLAGRIDAAAPINPMDILRWPGVLEAEAPDLASLRAHALALLDETLAELVATREREGARMQEVIAARCAALAEQVEIVQTRRPQVVAELRSRFEARLADLDLDADSGRLEQEMAIQAQRLDVDEELERLRSHVAEIESILSQRDPVGRRLDFLMQEFNREANTLGSKSGDVETTRAAMEMKVLIEQMREQIQNIE